MSTAITADLKDTSVGVLCHPGRISSEIVGHVLCALVFDASQENDVPTAVYPLVAGLTDDVASNALAFYCDHTELLVDSLVLFADVSSVLPASMALGICPSISAMFEDFAESLREVPGEDVIQADGWEAFLAFSDAAVRPSSLPPYDSRAVHRQLAALRALKGSDRCPGLQEDTERLEKIVRAYPNMDVRLEAMARDYRDALDGEIRLSNGYSVVVTVFAQQRPRAGGTFVWDKLGGVDVTIAFGLTASQAGHVYREVLKDPPRYAYGDMRLTGSEAFTVSEKAEMVRIVRDVHLSWMATDPTARRRFVPCHELLEQLVQRSDRDLPSRGVSAPAR